MKCKTALHESDEGYSVSVPGLPGCWSQGKTEAEALENIKDAIREYLAVVDECRVPDYLPEDSQIKVQRKMLCAD